MHARKACTCTKCTCKKTGLHEPPFSETPVYGGLTLAVCLQNSSMKWGIITPSLKMYGGGGHPLYDRIWYI